MRWCCVRFPVVIVVVVNFSSFARAKYEYNSNYLRDFRSMSRFCFAFVIVFCLSFS